MKPPFNLHAVFSALKTVWVFFFDKVITSYGWWNLNFSLNLNSFSRFNINSYIISCFLKHKNVFAFFPSIQWWSFLTLLHHSHLLFQLHTFFLPQQREHHISFFSGQGLIVLSCSVRVLAPHSNYFISVDICLGMTLDWKSPKLHLSQCSETKGPLDRLVNGLCVWWAGLVPCLRSHVPTTTQKRCLYVCLKSFTLAGMKGSEFHNRDWCELR